MKKGLFFHYQWIRTKGKKELLTCHEAYSEGNKLIALNPVPIEILDSDIETMANTDLRRFGVVDFVDIRSHIERYEELFELGYDEGIPDYWDEDIAYNEDVIDDGYDEKGNVIDLVDFINKRNK